MRSHLWCPKPGRVSASSVALVAPVKDEEHSAPVEHSAPADARSSGQLMFVRARGCASMTRKCVVSVGVYLLSAQAYRSMLTPRVPTECQRAVRPRGSLDCLLTRVCAYSQDTCASTHKRVHRDHLPDTTGWPWRAWPEAPPSAAPAAIRLTNTVWMPGGQGPGATRSTSLLLVRSHSAPSTNTATCARARRCHCRRHRTWGRVCFARHARNCTRTRMSPQGQTR